MNITTMSSFLVALPIVDSRMFRKKRIPRLSIRVCLFLAYLAFYLVHLDVHFTATSTASFFYDGYSLSSASKNSERLFCKETSQKKKQTSFRLNKRFHPENLFLAPVVLQDFIKHSFIIGTVFLNEQQPLTNYSFNSPSLRGPPRLV